MLQGDMEQAEPDAPMGREVLPTSRLEGLVVALAPGLFEVAANGQTYLCTLRGKLRKQRPSLPSPAFSRRSSGPPFRYVRGPVATPPPRPATPPEDEQRPVRIATGDRVIFTPLLNGEGVIEEVLPRRTVLSRMRSETGAEQVMLANLDQAILVFATRDPSPHLRLLDRYLALCEHARVTAIICFNKVDLGIPAGVAEAIRLYGELGYEVLLTSATTGEGIEALSARLAQKVSLLTGPSGVGKSSLMNTLLPEAKQRIGEISQATGKGRHTTTGARLLPLPQGGWLADSAGIRELALWHVPPDDLIRSFVELRPYVDQCLYEDCQHTANEEGCALRAALAEGHIAPSRFASFESLLEAARTEEQPSWA